MTRYITHFLPAGPRPATFKAVLAEQIAQGATVVVVRSKVVRR